MSQEETKLEEQTQEQAPVTEEVKPAGATDAGTETPPAEAPQPSVTQEQYDAAVRGMNEAQRERAAMEQERNQYQGLAQQAAGVVQQQTDPVGAAQVQLDQLVNEQYYGPEVEAARQRLYDAKLAQATQQSMQQAAYMHRVQSEMPEAQRLLQLNDQNVTANALNQHLQNMTPTQIARSMLDVQGKLGDVHAAEHKAKQDAAADAQLLGTLRAGGGRQVPGATQGAPSKFIYFEDWASLNDEAKNRYRNSDEAIEIVFTDAAGRRVETPAGFDPNKD